MTSILIVEDEMIVAKELSRCVRSLGYTVVGMVTEGNEAVRVAEQSKPDLVLMDIKLDGGMDGIHAADIIRTRFDIPVVYLSGYAESDVLERAKRTEPYGYLGKPVSLGDLRTTIDTSLYKHRADKRVRQSEELYHALVDSMGEGVILQDNRNIIRSFNAAAERILGFSADEVVGRSSLEIPWNFIREDGSPYPPDEHPSVVTLQTGKFFLESIMGVPTKNGDIKWIAVNTRPMVRAGETLPHAAVISFSDITRRKKAEEELRESEQRYRQMFERNRAVKLVIDPENSRIVDANTAASDFYGYDADELKSLRITDINMLPPEEVARKIEVARSGPEKPFLFPHRLKSGEIRNVEVHSGPIVLGGKTMLYSIIQDVTERKKAEDALRESEEKYHGLFDASPVGILLVGADGDVLDANPKFLDIVGSPSVEATRSINVFESPEINQAGFANAFRACMESGDTVVMEAPYTSTWGKHAFVRAVLNPVTDAAGEFRLIQAVIEDIRDRKEAEHALRESEERFRGVFENATVGIDIVDRNGQFVTANRALCEMLGYTQEEITSMTFVDITHPEDREISRARYRELLERERGSYRLEKRFVRKDGTTIRADLYVSTLHNSHGDFAGTLGIISDITERRDAERRIKESLEEKEVLLREIHHRVKNNLAVVHALLGIQSYHATDAFHREMFEASQQRIRSMALAHELLYDAERLTEIHARAYLGKLIENLTDSVVGVGDRISVVTDIADVTFGLDIGVPLGLILTELVSNAFKHAFPADRTGEIRIAFHPLGEDTFELEVSDNGVGIAENSEGSRRKSLGLDLVQTFVRQLRGDMTVLREGGTTIRVQFRMT